MITAAILFKIFFLSSLAFSTNRESSFPFVSGDSFRALANHLFDETHRCKPSDVKYKDIIFVKTDMLPDFFSQIHPHIQFPYILISHNSDLSAPGTFKEMLEDDKILVWFGQNPTIMNHPKFKPIPIGLANRMWSHGNVEAVTKLLRSKMVAEKKYLLGLNFNIGSAASIRKPVFDMFSSRSYCTNISSPDHLTYLKNMSLAMFILSPEGNGLDCVRTWEALLVGCVPIVMSSPLDELLAELPVWIINDWSEVTEESLHKQYKGMQDRFFTFNYEKMYMSYWIRFIEYHKQNASK